MNTTEESSISYVNEIKFMKIDPRLYEGEVDKTFYLTQSFWEWDEFWKKFYMVYWGVGFVAYMLLTSMNIKTQE